MEIVTDRSQEGSQFCKGFGGIGGILRYRVDFQSMEYESDEEFYDDAYYTLVKIHTNLHSCK